jgi:hypothetical protein
LLCAATTTTTTTATYKPPQQQAMVGMFARCTEEAVNKLDAAIAAASDDRCVGVVLLLLCPGAGAPLV